MPPSIETLHDSSREAPVPESDLREASPALSQILLLQAWRDEKLLNLIRSAI